MQYPPQRYDLPVSLSLLLSSASRVQHSNLLQRLLRSSNVFLDTFCRGSIFCQKTHSCDFHNGLQKEKKSNNYKPCSISPENAVRGISRLSPDHRGDANQRNRSGTAKTLSIRRGILRPSLWRYKTYYKLMSAFVSENPVSKELRAHVTVKIRLVFLYS